MSWQNAAAQAKRITASGVISTANKASILWGITLTAAAADATVDLRNGGSGGTILWSIHVKLEEGSNSIPFTKPIMFSTDIFATLMGSGAIVSVAFEEME